MIVLEFGSHSLKLHYRSRSSGIFRKSRIPWDLGNEVYSTGRISERTLHRAIETVRELRRQGIELGSIFAIATGALRDASNRGDFIARIEERLCLRVRVISAREEASLLANGYLSQSNDVPALLADLGGGSLEIVFLGGDRTVLRDSLPLGAIRVYHLGLDEDRSFRRELVEGYIQDAFNEAPIVKADAIHMTGGTMKAIAKGIGSRSISRSDLAALEEATIEKGPPSFVAPDRAYVFLPGLVVLRRFAEHAGASRIEYLKVPVGRIFLQRQVQGGLLSRCAQKGGGDL
ncbi:MAG TPA: hypothetical protein VK116_06385, partial [Planctomycetota bacterium]|nr:hypothetical protein [Planctomycetota bacterium]